MSVLDWDEGETLHNYLSTGGYNKLVKGRYGYILANKNDIVVARSALYYGEYYESEVDLFRQIIRPGWHVADIGANIGTHTQALSHIVGNTGWVYAFEPQRLVYQTLCSNIAINSISNVDAERMAVGSINKLVDIPEVDPHYKLNYGGITVADKCTMYNVSQCSIDTYINNRSLEFMKVDIEGMEREALVGARKTIKRCNTILYVENDKPAKSADLLDFIMNQLNYDCYWHLPVFHNPNNYGKKKEHIHGVGYVDNDREYYDTVGFGMNMLCFPKEFPVNIELMKVESPNEHPMIKGATKFHDF